MALRFIDSFDHYQLTHVTNKWTNNNLSSGFTTGRFGQGMEINNRWVNQVFDNQDTWVIGMALKKVGNPAADDNFIRVFDETTLQCDVRITPGGYLKITRNGTQIGSLSSTSLQNNVWNYVEFKLVIADSGGTAEVRVNGNTEVSYTGDTKNTTNAYANKIEFWGPNVGGWAIDDIYICDGIGGSPTNTFLGDVRIEALFPNDNGNSSQWVGSDADSTNNYLLIDDTINPDDADYVASSTVSNKDTYAFTNVTPTSGTVYGIQCVPRAAKSDAGTRSIASIARLGVTEVDSANKSLTLSYTYHRDIRETKPGGGTWSISDVNSAEFGVKVTV